MDFGMIAQILAALAAVVLPWLFSGSKTQAQSVTAKGLKGLDEA